MIGWSLLLLDILTKFGVQLPRVTTRGLQRKIIKWSSRMRPAICSAQLRLLQIISMTTWNSSLLRIYLPLLHQKHIHRFGANIVLLSTYGYRIQESSDPVLVRIHEGLEYTNSDLGILGLLLGAVPMRLSTLSFYFPSCILTAYYLMSVRCYPTWLPFSGFQKKLASSKKVIMASLRDEPFAKSKRLIVCGQT